MHSGAVYAGVPGVRPTAESRPPLRGASGEGGSGAGGGASPAQPPVSDPLGVAASSSSSPPSTYNAAQFVRKNAPNSKAYV